MLKKNSDMFADSTVLKKIEWDKVCSDISLFSQTEEGAELLMDLQPNLSREKIEKRWKILTSLKEVISFESQIPIGTLPPIRDIIVSCSLKRVLKTEDFVLLRQVLESTRRVCHFCESLSKECFFLAQIFSKFRGLTSLAEEIDRSLDQDGCIKDDASPKLKSLRSKTLNTTRSIESKLKDLLHKNKTYRQYLQDEYFTKRNERYVLPVRVDGKDRIAGVVVDISSSEQTLFIEPDEIKVLNDDLEKIKIFEKIEIIKLISELSSKVQIKKDAISSNYDLLVELDQLNSIVLYSQKINGNMPKIVDIPRIFLKNLHHPFLWMNRDQNSISNTVELEQQKNIYVISGPNAGGKTVLLKSIALSQVLAQSGVLVPCRQDSEMYLFRKLFFEIGDQQNISSGLSSFAAQTKGLQTIIKQVTDQDLVLIDEIASATEPSTGAAIAQSMLEFISKKKVKTVVTTHYDSLKVFALNRKDFVNGSMEYDPVTQKPCFRLMRGVPGQSYGLEVAEKTGLDTRVIARARDIKRSDSVAFNRAIADLEKSNLELKSLKNRHEHVLSDLEKKRTLYESKTKDLESSKKTILENLYNSYSKKLDKLNVQMSSIRDEYKKTIKNSSKNRNLQSENKKHSDFQKKSLDFSSEMGKIADLLEKEIKHPGKKVDLEKLKVDDLVYVVNLKAKAVVADVRKDTGVIEVKVGGITVRTNVANMRFLEKDRGDLPPKPLAKKRSDTFSSKNIIPYRSPLNTLDLRGVHIEVAIHKLWKYIDAAILRGEEIIFIKHGYGGDSSKNKIREILEHSCPYNVAFESGKKTFNDDSITIVKVL